MAVSETLVLDTIAGIGLRYEELLTSQDYITYRAGVRDEVKGLRRAIQSDGGYAPLRVFAAAAGLDYDHMSFTEADEQVHEGFSAIRERFGPDMVGQHVAEVLGEADERRIVAGGLLVAARYGDGSSPLLWHVGHQEMRAEVAVAPCMEWSGEDREQDVSGKLVVAQLFDRDGPGAGAHTAGEVITGEIVVLYDRSSKILVGAAAIQGEGATLSGYRAEEFAIRSAQILALHPQQGTEQSDTEGSPAPARTRTVRSKLL